jgi:antitoxin MazE
MDIPVIPIGNSKGIRIPKTLLAKYGIGNRVCLVLEEDQIILKPYTRPRAGWDEAFAKMRENNDDLLLDADILNDDLVEPW